MPSVIDEPTAAPGDDRAAEHAAALEFVRGLSVPDDNGDGDAAAPAQRAKADQRRSPAVAVLAVAVTAVLLAMPGTRMLAGTVLALLVLVTVHEFGHLLAARASGVGAPEFSVGFGPLVWRSRPRLHADGSYRTSYCIRALPFGGYVQIKGLGAPARTPGRSYQDVRWSRKVLIAVAGPLANVLTAALIVIAVFAFLPLREATTEVTPTDGSPAAAAGLRAGDQILAVDGVAVRSWTEVTDGVARHDPSIPVLLSVQRDGAPLELSVAPDLDADTGHARIGVRTVEVDQPKSLGHVLTGSASTTSGLFTQTGQSLGSVASVVADLPAQFLGHSSHPERRFLSPLGAARVADDQASNAGPAALFGLAASVSMFLAFFNLLPVPPLDGGHIAVATYEAIASRLRRRVVRVDRRKLAPITTAVILLVTIIGVSSIALDIIRPLAVH